MFALSRRAVMLNASAFAAAFALGGCTSSSPDGEPQATALVTEPAPSFGVNPDYVAMYGPVEGRALPIPAVDLTKIDPAFLRTEVDYTTTEPPGTIIVDPQSRYLYFVQPGAERSAMRRASARKASSGRARRRSTASRSGRTGIRPPR
jgi:lipoprotein-anchoring transpeptidase ErfK/SrfK